MYSEEYFELLRSRLKPFGLAVTWAPTERVASTFLKVFPHVLAFQEIHIGSNDPIDFDRETVNARLASQDVKEHFALAGVNIARLLGAYLDGRIDRFGPDHDRSRLTDINTDLFPKDEYHLPALRR